MTADGSRGPHPAPPPAAELAFLDNPPEWEGLGRRFLSPRQLMWLRFRRNRMAVAGAVILLGMYLLAAFAPFMAPYAPQTRFPDHLYLQPRRIHLREADGGAWRRPFVYKVTLELDLENFQRTFVEDHSARTPVRLFVRGDPYRLWGLFPMDRHLFGIDDPEEYGPLFLLGGDKFGRDLLARVLDGARISLTLGLVGVAIVLAVGLLLGGLSGLLGGVADNIVQRLIEFVRSIPTIPLWMGLAAALPPDMSPVPRYFAITVIVSFVGWTSLARVVRGKFLSLREEDFILAARAASATEFYLIRAHLIPSFMSYVLVHVTLAIPGMILAETALSYLGLGLRSPTISWGVLLNDAQQLVEIGVHPWILWPAAYVVLTVLAFNFVGDGLRDAADPYAQAGASA